MILFKCKLYSVCFAIIFLSVSAMTHAVVKMEPFFQGTPNKFWPYHQESWQGRAEKGLTKLWFKEQGLYTVDLFDNSPLTNPDVFCDSLGEGYRVPSIAEFTLAAIGTPPFSNLNSGQGIPPLHWSQYLNNNINSPLKPKSNNRVIGSVSNEWGDLSKYGQTWSDTNGYWAAEPITIGQLDTRWYFTPNGVANKQDTNRNQKSIACVSDLIPTPINQNNAENL